LEAVFFCENSIGEKSLSQLMVANRFSHNKRGYGYSRP